MNAKLALRILAAFLCITASAFAQIDGTSLRAKYGPPLSREIFTVLSGVEMVVDYATNGHVCRIQLPAVGPSQDPGVSTTKAIDDLVSELVPMAVRGKELGRFMFVSGPNTMSMTKYENVTIAERKTVGVTVTFTKDLCRDQPSQ